MTVWRASNRFLRAFDRASPPLQSLAVAEVKRVQLMEISVKDWMSNFGRVQGMRERSVLELELGGGPRLDCWFTSAMASARF